MRHFETTNWDRESYKFATFQEKLEIKSGEERENEIREPNHQIQSINKFQNYQRRTLNQKESMVNMKL